MPTLRQLQALELIGQTASFTRTAERLFVTQSAISILVRELEAELGTRLVVRGRTARLTEAGEHLQRAGHQALREVARAVEDVKAGRHTASAVIRLGAGSLSAATFIPSALRRLHDEALPLRVEVIDRPAMLLTDLLVSGEADVVIGSTDASLKQSGEFKSELLICDTLCVVCALDHPLAGKMPPRARGVRWQDLEGTELILVGRNGGQWRALLLDQLARQRHLTVGYEVQLYSTALALVRQGLGAAVLPRHAGEYLDRDIYAVRPLISPGTRWSTYWVARKRSMVDPAALAQLHRAVSLSLQ
ncbi:LysR family transcriptional regulator [Variovorax sp. RA8]|uniref:LysR family transcriptional regulator n=1 Tax=Variovorax sp. (strain JCM 16519 / RA8) TaxID=662548 RepID=UPI001315E1CB|nr:LysR family transcriptional regulator [Variovorax sp. RA8]VTU29712.1 Cyn operon transcriptional activator [Variovorax sp. RA8]